MSSIFGLYRALVQNNNDPLSRHRLQVQVPALNGVPLSWAEACVPATDFHIPKIGDAVWVMFEAGDIHSPVWVGVLPGPAA